MSQRSPVTLVILIPTPGHVVTGFFKSLIGLTQALSKRGIAFAVKTYEFSDIVMSRNYLMSYFLSNPRFTHALCLDCDLEFQPAQFFRLLDFGADCAIAPYPRRQMSVARLLGELHENLDRPEMDRLTNPQMLARALGHVVQKNTSQPRWAPKRKGDFVTVPSAGFGFTLITRRVPELMVEKQLLRGFPDQGRLPIYADAPEFYEFFNHMVSPDGRYILGEDQSFFHRWGFGCGQDIWADGTARITHHGSYGFHGDYSVERPDTAPPHSEKDGGGEAG